MLDSRLESNIAKQVSLLRSKEKISVRVATDKILSAFHIAPANREDLYLEVERRIAAHDRKVKLMKDLVEATSKIYNDPKYPVGMPDAIEVVLNQAGIEDAEERAWFRERIGRRMQQRSLARRKANLRNGKQPKKRGRSHALRPTGHQVRLPLRAPRPDKR